MLLKTCKMCGQEKPIAEFTVLKGAPWRFCRPCNASRSREWRRKNPGQVIEKRRANYAKNADKIKTQAKARYHSDPERSRLRQVLQAYGISESELTAPHEQQGGCCALCKRPAAASRKGKLFVDHCHETGRVRGLLCMACNSALGVLGDTVAALERVLTYVRGAQDDGDRDCGPRAQAPPRAREAAADP